MKIIKQLGKAIVDFVDRERNLFADTWRERGNLLVVEFADKKFFFLENEKGNRIFPLSNRRAEVYLNESEEAYIVEHDYDMNDWQNIQEQV